MTRQDLEQRTPREFLPLGTIVILKGSVKKLLIVSRGSIVEDAFFDYGAFLYPEGMIDTKVAYFNHDDILKVVFEGYVDADNALVLEILSDAYASFERRPAVSASPASTSAPVSASLAGLPDDPFASVRDLLDDDE